MFLFQGLGKTVQTIAFLALLLEQGEKGPHVVVAPSSTLGVCILFVEVYKVQIKGSIYINLIVIARV